MSVKGFFKSVLNPDAKVGEQAEETGTTGATSTTTSLSSSATAGVNNFLSGTSKFLDSVQTKKNGLINDLSNKLTSLKMPGEQSTNESAKKKKSRSNDDDDDSSASEYGDDGDCPMYAEVAPVERQVSVESIDSLPDEDAERPVSSNGTAEQKYLYVLLKDQVIWQSMRFWNAAFFIALQRERAERQRYPVIEGDDPIQAETDFQNDIAYSQL
ncbi:uncharacterized protein DC041_0005579, partial [Schistosoma bovis]